MYDMCWSLEGQGGATLCEHRRWARYIRVPSPALQLHFLMIAPPPGAIRRASPTHTPGKLNVRSRGACGVMNAGVEQVGMVKAQKAETVKPQSGSKWAMTVLCSFGVPPPLSNTPS